MSKERRYRDIPATIANIVAILALVTALVLASIMVYKTFGKWVPNEFGFKMLILVVFFYILGHIAGNFEEIRYIFREISKRRRCDCNGAC